MTPIFVQCNCRLGRIESIFIEGIMDNNERDKHIITQYCDGETMPTLAERFKISRQRVCQIINDHGLDRFDGGIFKKITEKREQKILKRQESLERRLMANYGLTLKDYFNIRQYQADAWKSYIQQRINCAARLIRFDLTFPIWFEIWQRSKKWKQRGTGRDNYVMCRRDINQGFVIGNIKIVKWQECKQIQRGDKHE